MPEQDPVHPSTDMSWKQHLPASRPQHVLGDRPGDVLCSEQRQRSAAAHEAGRMILAEDPPPEDIIMLADYIVTGRRPPAAVKVLPDESLIEQVVQRVARAASRVDLPGSDAATWTAPEGAIFDEVADYGRRPNEAAGGGLSRG